MFPRRTRFSKLAQSDGANHSERPLTCSHSEKASIAMSNKTYNSEFFSDIDETGFRSASAILPIVFNALQPKTVIDVGCGTGAWLAVASELGASVIGIDGKWVIDTPKFRPDKDIRFQDLEAPIPDLPKVDLAICLEVAEHLTPERGPSLISDLCRLSEHVLFSAAIPRQRGTNHINCRWQSYWASLFRQYGRVPIDL